MKKILRLLLLIASLAMVFVQTYDPALALCGEVILNEIDYDQSGTDQAEFVELKGPPGADLATIEVHFVNGLNGAIYQSQPLAGFLPEDGYLVLGSDSVPNVDLLIGSGGSNLIQNGAPDGIGVWDSETQTYCDFINYEGSVSGFEGWPILGADPASLCITGASDSLARPEALPSPTDDWVTGACASPGEPNLGPTAVLTTSFSGQPGSINPLPASWFVLGILLMVGSISRFWTWLLF